MKLRDTYFDIVKAIAMYMVVVWHIMEKNIQILSQGGGNFAVSLILGMNMAVFFVVAGYFAHTTVVECKWHKLLQHLRQYYCPFASISVLFSLLAVCLGTICLSQAPLYALKRFLFAGWFIWALAITYSLSFIGYNMHKWLKCGNGVMWVVIVYMLTFALPPGLWWIGSVRSMAPHFIIGLFLLRRYQLYKNNWLGMIAIICYIGMIVAENVLSPTRITFYGLKTSLIDFAESPLDILKFLYVAAKGFIGTIGIMWVVWFFKDNIGFLARYGTETLGVYLVHQWLIDGLDDAGLVPSNLALVLMFAVALFLQCHYLVVASKRIPFVGKYIWGRT